MLASLRKSWPFLFAALLGIYFITLNITGLDFSHYPGDLGDGRFTMYLLEHAYQYFSGQVREYWNAGFMVPEENVISYSENLLGAAPFYSIFRILGLDVITSFQAWFILMTLLNFGFCYLFLLKCCHDHYAAALGAMVFAFSMALQSQMTHSQTFLRFPIPLTFLIAFLFFETFKPKYFFLLLLVWVFQLYACIYTGFMLFVPLAIFFLLSSAYQWQSLREKIKNLSWLSLMGASAVINLALLIPLMYPYKIRAGMVSMYNYKSILENIPTPYSHFFSQPGTLLWRSLQNTAVAYPAFWDHQIFTGALATLCLVLFWVILPLKIRKPGLFKSFALSIPVKVMFFTSILTFLFFLRFGHFSFYQYIHQLPGFASMRAIQRIINIELLFFALGTTIVFMLIKPGNAILKALMFLLFAALLTLDNYYVRGGSSIASAQRSRERTDPLIQKMKSIPPGSLVSYEPDTLETRSIFYQIDAMLAAQALHLRAVNGYTGTSPRGYNTYWEKPGQAGREEWFAIKNFRPDTVYIIK
jgi:hypothetical protein